MAADLTYSYRAVDSAGKQKKGTLDAPSRERAFQLLRAQGLTPKQVMEKRNTALDAEINIPGFEKKAKLSALAVFAKQFALLIKSGMRIPESVQITANQTEDKVLKKALSEVGEDIEKGMPLSASMRKHPQAFPKLLTAIVAVGEDGGFLDRSLMSMSKSYKSDLELKQKIKSAMTYPVIVVAASLLVVTAMLIFIVPVFAEMFESMDAELPAITQGLVNLSNNMIIIGPILLVVLLACYIFYQKYKEEEWFLSRLDAFKLKVPVFGKLTQKIVIARFSRNLSMMLSAGVHLPQALKMVSETANNWVISNAIDSSIKAMEAGRNFSSSIEKFDIFPMMVKQMIIVGELSGSLPEMLEATADFYDDEVREASESLSNSLEPIMIVMLGVLVGGMLFALYMPMFNLMNVMSEG